MENHDVLKTFIEIEPVNVDTFLTVKETLTRMGIASKSGDIPTLWQSCHIFHKQGKYYIVHFKQMFLLDGKGKNTTFSEEDQRRLMVVCNLLEQWGLIKLKVPINPDEILSVNLTIIPFSDKNNWELKSKYHVGRKY